MIRVVRLIDPEIIRRTMAHPRIYPHIIDDNSPPIEEYEPVIAEQVYYLGLFEDGYLGLLVFHPQNSVCYEAHTCLLPAAWGQRSAECTKAAVAWMFENTPCQRVITNVPAYNRLALRLAERTGLTQFGVNLKSHLKDGVLHDQIMLGVSKE